MSLWTPAKLLWTIWGLAAITIGAPVLRELPIAMTPGNLLEKCTVPRTLASNCSSNSTVELYYFDDAQCISFQGCNTDPDNVTTFETKEACQTECQASSCTLPPPPPHGSYSRGFHQGYVYLWYSCNRGFKLSGSVSRVCLRNNTWSAPEPSCKTVTCPRNGINSEILYSFCPGPLTSGCTALFTCHKSMTRFGKVFRTCKTDGTWSTDIDPYCARMYVTCNGKERTSLTIQSKSPLQLHCGIDPYLPRNAVISWNRVPDGTGIRKAAGGGVILNFPVVRASHAGDYTCIMRLNRTGGRTIKLSSSITISVKAETKQCKTRPAVYIKKPYLFVENKLIIACLVQSCSKTSQTWYYNNSRLITGEGVTITNTSDKHTTFSQLTVDNANLTNLGGVYICEAQNTMGTTQSALVIPGFSNFTSGASAPRRKRGARHNIVSSRASVFTDKAIITLLGRLVGQLSTSDTMYIYYVAVDKTADGNSLNPIINIIHDTPLDIPHNKTVTFSVKCKGSHCSLLIFKTLTEHQLTPIQTD